MQYTRYSEPFVLSQETFQELYDEGVNDLWHKATGMKEQS